MGSGSLLFTSSLASQTNVQLQALVLGIDDPFFVHHHVAVLHAGHLVGTGRHGGDGQLLGDVLAAPGDLALDGAPLVPLGVGGID